jgi:uncharacterized protein YecT (DUF1311 family)
VKQKIMALLSMAVAACSQPAEKGEAPQPTDAAARLSFDCTGVVAGARSLVCSDAELAALDREMARLYELASAAPDLPADREAELKDSQKVWLNGRDGCAEARDPRYCLFSSYSGRINELRMGSENARSDDAAGISRGPMALACDGVESLVAVTLLRTDPGGAFVLWPDNGVALRRMPDAKTELYAGDNAEGDVRLERNSNTARLTLPGDAVPHQCHFEDIG